MHQLSLEHALELDRTDPLAEFRSRFLFPVHEGKQQIYFLGNSLGLQPIATPGYIQEILRQWQTDGVESFFRGDDPWLKYHEHLSAPLSELLGCKPSEITVMNQLTVNLHLMLVSFYRPKGKKKKILCEAKAFPSDQYMLETHVRFYGYDPDDTIIEVSPREGEHIIRTEDILAAIETNKEELALVLWGGVNYYTGQVFDLKTITDAAHQAGVVAGFDLAHAAGNINLSLHDWDVDFACWCNYKYLNAGPGAVGGAYIHERYHKENNIPRFAGWWGYDPQTRFLMEKGFKPNATAEGWQLSTPSPILFACLRASLNLFQEAGWKRLQQKREGLMNWCWYLLEHLQTDFSDKKIKYLTPVGQEGSQVSMMINEGGKEIFEALGREGIMTDWREPGVIRIAPVPLYNSFEDLWHFYVVLKNMLRKK